MPNSPTTKQRLSALSERGDWHNQGGRAYSFIVRKLRWILPIMALCIVLFLMVWPRIQTELENIRFKVQPIDQKVLEQAATETRLLQADFSSTDSKGRPYRVLADEAIQQNDDPDMIDLTNPDASLQTSESETMTATSAKGHLNQSTHDLTLEQSVTITRTDGTVLNTEILNLNLQSHDANTDQPITIKGDDIDLTATGMHTQNGGDIIIFAGPAKAILHQTKGDE